jgi:hypothetical protein
VLCGSDEEEKKEGSLCCMITRSPSTYYSATTTPVVEAVPVKKKGPNPWIILAVVIVFLGIIAAILYFTGVFGKKAAPKCTTAATCPAGQACVGGRCGPCTGTGQCRSNETCTTSTGVCAADIATSCTSSTTCPAGQACVGGTCGPCTGTGQAQCRPNETCVSGTCTAAGVVGRYVKLSQSGMFLHIMEMKVFSNGVNVSKNKPATTSGANSDAPGAYAVDDNLTTLYHSQREGAEYVTIDLGSDLPITEIVVYNRSDDPRLRGRLLGSIVQILDKNNAVVWTSEPFKSSTGSIIPINVNETTGPTGFLVYRMAPPSTVVTGAAA